MAKPRAPIKARKGKPSHAYRATLRPMTQADADKLLEGVLNAILTHSLGMKACVMVATSYLVKLPEDFPKGHIRGREGLLDYRVFRCKAVLEWLHKHGYTALTPENMRSYRAKAGYVINDIERKIETYGERED